MVLLEGLPAEGAFWRVIVAKQTERENVRDAQRRKLGLGAPSRFRHRR